MADSSSSVPRQYRDYTRYLRPVRSVSFTDIEMLQSVVQCLDPEDVASVAQLLGTRRGVVRITMKTTDGIARLEDAIRRRRLTVAGSPLGIVEDGGQFVVVTLDNVPHYVTDEQVEQEMSRYGMVASCSKDFVDIKGFRIENERRNVLFSMIFNKEAISNGELDMFGTTVYAKTPYETLTEATDASAGSSATGTNSAESSARRNTAADQQQYPIGLQSQGKQHGGGSARGGTNKQQGDGHGGSAPNAWKRASNLVIMQGDSNQTPSSVPAAADQPSTGKPMQTTAVIGGDQPQASTASDLPPPPPLSSTTTTTSARMGVRHSIAGRSPGVQGGCDARQLQKRTEAFEQLSAFLQ